MNLKTEVLPVALIMLMGGALAGLTDSSGVLSLSAAHYAWVPVWAYAMFGALLGGLHGLRLMFEFKWSVRKGVSAVVIGAFALGAVAFVVASLDMRGLFGGAPVWLATLWGAGIAGVVGMIALRIDRLGPAPEVVND